MAGPPAHVYPCARGMAQVKRIGVAAACGLLIAMSVAGCGQSAPAGTRATATAATGQGTPAATTTTGNPASATGTAAAKVGATTTGSAGAGAAPGGQATGTATASAARATSPAGATGASTATGPASTTTATASTTATAEPNRTATPTATATPTTATSPAATGPRPAAPSPASVPPALRGVEAVRFASPVTQASSGPDLGDVAVVTANQNLHIFLAGVPQPVVPLVNFAAWVPGSDWVIASRLSPPTIQGSKVLGYNLLLAGSRQSVVPLPACTDAPPQGVLGPAVAFLCGRTLEVADVGSGGLTPPHVYAWTASLDASRFVLNPAGTLVAAVLAKSCYVRAFKLATEAEWPGTYTAAYPNCPDTLAWSASGTLAIAAFPGVTLWSPGHVATFARDGDFHALLWTADGLLAISGTPGNGPWAEVIAPDGTARAVTAPSAPVLAFTAGGTHAWIAVSFPGNPATYGIAATGA